jgi:hypothetical protein
MQQWAILRERGYSNPDPIKIFYDDLEEQLNVWKQQNKEIIIMINANKHIGEKSSRLLEIFRKTDMTELLRQRHTNLSEPNTHIRGLKQIDYIFGTNRVAQNCKKAGILPFGLGYHSDHRAVFAEIDLENILATQVTSVDSITARKLIQATPKERTIFIQKVHEFLENQNIYHRLNSLQAPKPEWTKEDITEYKACDEVVIQGMLWAETKTRNMKTMAWSPKFGSAVANKSFWKIALSLKTNH